MQAYAEIFSRAYHLWLAIDEKFSFMLIGYTVRYVF